MRLRLLRYAVLASLIALLAGCAVDDTEPPRGAQILAGFKSQLQSALQAGMSEGPVEAIAVCRIQAPEIAGSLSRDGIRVGRASHRLRNPANIAPDWVKPILAGYLDAATDREPQEVTLPGNRSGYVEPIVTQPLCLNCHGKALAPAVADKLGELYPDDQAVGFAVGELRGVFWVEYPRGS